MENQIGVEKRNLESKLFETFLTALKESYNGNGSEAIWHNLLQNFFNESQKEYPQILTCQEDLSNLTLIIKIEDVERVIQEKKVDYEEACRNWQFPLKVKVEGKCKIFKLFDLAIFHKDVEFHNFESDTIDFSCTHFLGSFVINSKQYLRVKNVGFFACYFEKDFSITEQEFDSFRMILTRFGKEVKLSSLRTIFSRSFILTSTPAILAGDYELESINLEKSVIFEGNFVFDLRINKCPDFSKASFSKSKNIIETWQVDEKKITKDDESKFRFLKKYFAEQGNHFKEQEYFSYEMMAREKKLKDEGGAEQFLFLAYKRLSNFGMSISRPFLALVMSLVFFGFLSWSFGCDFGSAFANSFVKTLNPLAKFECEVSSANSFIPAFLSSENFFEIFKIKKQSLEISNSIRIISAIQSIINGGLISFLIFGLRNKFKIK